jgi:chaperonin cofactor prefoldin
LYGALQFLEQALQILEECLIPPVLLYYQIYRYMGVLFYKTQQREQAKEALSESVEIIEKYL